MNSLVNRFAWGNYEKGKTVCCLIIVVIFMGLEGAYRVGEIFKSLNGGQATKGWDDLLWAS